MTDLVKRASEYATQAHRRINHRRKYSKQPYDAHLEAVAKLVASVTDDPEMIAAAWLHDTVEDTPATLDDIESEFGHGVAELVEELTDVSRPGDGNRAVRKEIDREHTTQASARAKTVKLADLIDNCRDITKHDPRFARVYLAEMNRLLDVLTSGDPDLYRQAQKAYMKGMDKIGPATAGEENGEVLPPHDRSPFDHPHLRRAFTENFTAGDIAGPLLSFDADKSSSYVKKALEKQNHDVASVRINGSVQGYVRLDDLGSGDCAEHIRHFTRDQVIDSDAGLIDVIHVLTRHDKCFVTMFNNVTGQVCRDDINKPIVRMWLFGVITFVEMVVTDMIGRYYPGDGWHSKVSESRLERAREFQAERQRRNQNCDLVDCLQFSEKGQILIENEMMLKRMGFDTKRAAKRVIREMESLRNNLAHAQDIVTHDWAQIARMAQRMGNTESR